MKSTSRAIWQNSIRPLGRLVGVGVLLAAVAAPSFGASSPAARWAKGDSWDVQLEQQEMQGARKPMGWLTSFQLHFEVAERTSKEVRVEVRTVPENRFAEHLVLRYKPSGELLTAQIVDPERVTLLGGAGGCGVFGMLGREAFEVLKAPAERGRGGAGIASALTRVQMDDAGVSVQSWRAGDGYWRRFESRAGIPQRATLLKGSWKNVEGSAR